MAAAAIPLIISGISALGGILGNRKQTQVSTSQQNNREQSGFTNSRNLFGNQSTTTNYDPALLGLRGNLISKANTLMGPNGMMDPGAWARGVIQSNVGGINNKAALSQRILQNTLRQKGLGSSVAGAYAAAQGEDQRIANLINNSNQLPILQRQAELENAQQMNAQQQLANQIFSMIPKDTYSENWQGGDTWGSSNSESSSTGRTEGVAPGNMLSGGFSSLASMLAYLFGQGAFSGIGGSSTGSRVPDETNGWNG